MLDEGRQQRLDALRVREALGSLTEGERIELDKFLNELDRQETTSLQPAVDRLSVENLELEAEKVEREAELQSLQRIAAAQTQLLEEAQAYLRTLRTRRAELVDHYRHVTGKELL